MRERVSLFIFISAFVLMLSSCFYAIMIPEEDTSKLTQKTTFNSFESLNNPVIFYQRVEIDFKEKRGKQKTTYKEGIGSVFYVYDWETNTIFDYLYSPNYIGTQNLIMNQLAPDENGHTGYYLFRNFDRNYLSINRNQNHFELNKIDDICYVNNFNHTCETLEKIPFFVVTKYSNKDINHQSINTYNLKTKTFGEPVNFTYPGVSGVYISGFSDTDGTYWFSSKETEYDKQKKAYRLFKYDTNQNTIESFTMPEYFETAEYKILNPDSDYVYISMVPDYDYSNKPATKTYYIWCFNKNTKEFTKKVSFELETDSYIQGYVLLNGKKYTFISTNEKDDDKPVTIAAFDILNGTFEELLTVPKEDFMPGEFFVRGNKIYSLFNGEYKENYTETIYCYDTAENTAERLIELKPENLWK